MNITKRPVELHARRASFCLNLPFVRAVCSRCDGEGKHVNPAVDGNGITAEEMDELGDDFRESYMSGVYDVRCEECNGERVVWEIAYDKLTKRERILWDYHHEQENAARAERESELRYGY